MPRPECPVDPATGPIAEFAVHLRALRHAAGRPSYRLLSVGTHYSWVTLATAARGNRLPTWDVVSTFIAACRTRCGPIACPGDDDPSHWTEETWRARWERAKAATGTTSTRPAGSSDTPVAPTCSLQSEAPSGELQECSVVDTSDGSSRPWQVEIIDSHELVGAALAAVLAAEGAQVVCAPVRSAADVVEHLRVVAPCQVLLEVDLGRDTNGERIDGVELIAPMVEQGNQVVVLSGSSDAGRIGAALARGAFVWVPKNAPLPTLFAALREARAGRSIMPPGRREQLIELYRARDHERRDVHKRLDRLTQREHEVLAQLAAGKRAQAVADHFVVSLATVRTQLRAVLQKLEAASQLEAVALYRRSSGS